MSSPEKEKLLLSPLLSAVLPFLRVVFVHRFTFLFTFLGLWGLLIWLNLSYTRSFQTTARIQIGTQFRPGDPGGRPTLHPIQPPIRLSQELVDRAAAIATEWSARAGLSSASPNVSKDEPLMGHVDLVIQGRTGEDTEAYLKALVQPSLERHDEQYARLRLSNETLLASSHKRSEEIRASLEKLMRSPKPLTPQWVVACAQVNSVLNDMERDQANWSMLLHGGIVSQTHLMNASTASREPGSGKLITNVGLAFGFSLMVALLVVLAQNWIVRTLPLWRAVLRSSSV